MRRLLYILAAIILIVIMFAAVYFSGMIFDASRHITITPSVLQTANLSGERVGRPVPIEQLDDGFILDRLIAKYVYEYFYVVPDTNNVAARSVANGTLALLSAPDVFADWTKNVAPTLSQMANAGTLRNVSIDTEKITTTGDYMAVPYTLTAYTHPNDIAAAPEITHGIMYMRLDPPFAGGVRETMNGAPFDVGTYLTRSTHVAAIFKFRVAEVK